MMYLFGYYLRFAAIALILIGLGATIPELLEAHEEQAVQQQSLTSQSVDVHG